MSEPAVPGVKSWDPFSIDALGLITLLGANSLQKVLGRLVQHPWAECFPLLAGNIIPDDDIGEPVPGFILYNLTDQIKVNGVNAWFSRWLLCQNLSRNSTILDVEISHWRKRHDTQDIVSTLLGVIIHSALIVFSILILDWYGLAASISVTLSTLTRVVVLRMCRTSLDEQVTEAQNHSKSIVKCLVDLPNGKTVTVYVSRGAVIKCLLAQIHPRNKRAHKFWRAIGWASFGVFIVALGMACLAMQLLIAIPVIVSSLIVIQRLGCDETVIGTLLRIKSHTIPGLESHMRTYAALQLTPLEEDAMVEWGLFPLRTNQKWWSSYRKFYHEFHTDPSAFEGQYNHHKDLISPATPAKKAAGHTFTSLNDDEIHPARSGTI